MSEDDFFKKAAVVKLDTLSDVNDIGKPVALRGRWHDGYPHKSLVSAGMSSRGLWTQTLRRCRRASRAR